MRILARFSSRLCAYYTGSRLYVAAQAAETIELVLWLGWYNGPQQIACMSPLSDLVTEIIEQYIVHSPGRVVE